MPIPLKVLDAFSKEGPGHSLGVRDPRAGGRCRAGERACPAGTAALIVAWTMLRALLGRWEMEEKEEGHAARSCYLRPVLLTEGPQMVVVSKVRSD
mmetsp:Transcript_17958/g.36163  ORF Transcript_17958/g.36163 Transcript_17958/m.36163 type:complete len:96 (-) Transcript_17958:147-434(-)